MNHKSNFLLKLIKRSQTIKLTIKLKIAGAGKCRLANFIQVAVESELIGTFQLDWRRLMRLGRRWRWWCVPVATVFGHFARLSRCRTQRKGRDGTGGRSIRSRTMKERMVGVVGVGIKTETMERVIGSQGNGGRKIGRQVELVVCFVIEIGA